MQRKLPLWALAPEEPLPSRVVNVPIHISCTAEAMHPPLDGSLMCYITYDSVIIQTCISMH